ncbi:MAG TPA: TIGR03790 family protein [Pontiella sp.]|nr:TIGR03790 family protein [Pontiella sp.]
MSKVSILLACVLAATGAWAQMPHEVLLLVNRKSQPSMHVANTFAAARQIPERNMVYLDIPDKFFGGKATITPEQFTSLIWEPANAAAKERGIDQQILAWVYSVDFPIRIKTDDNDRRQMSVGGLTFVRNRVPGLSLIEDGKFHSKLFAGPNDRLKFNLSALSLGMMKSGLGEDVQVPAEVAYLQKGLQDDMPLPSMMLGYVGQNGNRLETVLDTIQRGVRSDYRGPRSGFYFVTSDDVRSKCREWQFAPVVDELQARGITATITTNFPAGVSDVMGLLMGAENVDPSKIGSFAPGAMAEHLTSWSAEFQRPQTKVTEWLKAGATASVGAVVEPYSNHNKFPSARFYAHYTSGCTMLESLYQSIACPLQTLMLGEPMARPYAVPLAVRLLGKDTVSQAFTYVAQVQCRIPNAEFRYSFLLDGKEIQPVSDNYSFPVRAEELSDGYHELRVVARMKHRVEFSASSDRGIMVDRLGRSVSILPDIKQLMKYKHAIKVQIKGTDRPEQLRLLVGHHVIDEVPYSDDAQLTLDELLVGEGPVRIRAVAVYGDGMEVSSPPVATVVSFDG